VILVYLLTEGYKKATGLEFAHGCVTDLGKAKYEQAHSA